MLLVQYPVPDRPVMTFGREHKAALMVSVAKEDGLYGEALESGKRLGRANDIFVLVGRGAVDELEAVHRHRALGQVAEKCRVLDRQLVASPESADASEGIE